MTRKKTVARLLGNQRGMTLIEIMVVIAILGMMATIITVAFVKYLDDSKVEATRIQMHNIVVALDAYKIQHGSYPTTEEGLGVLVSKGAMKKLPKDAWGKEFEYIRQNSSAYLLKSYGADGAAGGDGYDEDLTSADN